MCVDCLRIHQPKKAQKALKPVEKPRGKSKNTHLATLQKQLKLKDINSIEKAQSITRDRDIWRNTLGLSRKKRSIKQKLE